MLFYTTAIFRNGAVLFPKYNLNNVVEDLSKILQVRCYAARRGTREKKNKAKVKAEVEKVGFIPHNQRNKDKLLLHRTSKKYDDSWKRDPTDNVYFRKYFKQPLYAFEEAIKCHRETHHPEMYNQPNANLHVSVELNMDGEKKNRFVDDFTRIVAIPHKFDHGEERSIIAFSKSPEYQKDAADAGAQLSGGAQLIKQIQNGDVILQDFQFIIAHPDILPELVALRGLMKRRFPSPRLGTLDPNLGKLVEKFVSGISYTAAKDVYEKDFGLVDTVIGTLNMDVEHLEGNLSVLLKDIYTMKPKRDGLFIRRCLLWSPPSREKLTLDLNIYLDVQESMKTAEEDEELGERVAL